MVNNNNLNLVDKRESSQNQMPVKEEMNFKELYEKSLPSFQYGDIIKGKVVLIKDDKVMVDVGWKTEGFVPIDELKDAQGKVTVCVGDEIDVSVERRDADGNFVLSMEKASKVKVWEDIKKAYENNSAMEGVVVEKVKGGLSVNIGIKAFLPGSQIDIRPVKDLDRFIGQTLSLRILKYDKKRNNVIVSRRMIIESEKTEAKKALLQNMHEGKIVEGVIKNITDYGVFVDLGGMDGLLHITDISWGKMVKPSDIFQNGQKIRTKVLSFDPEKERVSLGYKQLTENPWEKIHEKYPVGKIVEGKVVNLTDYGVFVELEFGVEGLVHVSEMFWTREIKHPSKVFHIGDIVQVKVLEVNAENKRIALSIKQTTSNPWERLKEKYPVGTTVKGVVKNVTSFGVFVGVEDDIDGLVHISDISWKHRITHPSECFKKGQEIEAVVLNIDPAHEKFSLGIKQLEKDPWEEIAQRYVPGSVVTGKITNFTEFGIFVEIEEGIEGLVHISEISKKRVKTSSELHSLGETVSAVVKSIDPKFHKIRLSMKDLELLQEPSSSAYLNNATNVGSNLGQALADAKMNTPLKEE